MKIAFDTWTLASRFRNQGTYVYAQNLILELKKAAKRMSEVEFCVFAPHHGGNDASLMEPDTGFSVTKSRLLNYERLWRMGGASTAAKQIGAGLMFSPSCNLLPLAKPPLVCTIHDATPIVMPSHSKRMVMAQKIFLRAAARRSRAVITVSERSRKDLIETCGIPEEKVTVVHNGYDKETFNEAPPNAAQLSELRQRMGIRRLYLFHHGVIQPRKNLKRLVQAYRLMLSRNRDLELDLVLAGPLDWEHEQVLAEGEESRSKRGQVIFPGTLSKRDLALLLKGAAMVVIPSLYEGFCLPMVESMACGVPTIVSDSSCFPEISGNALEYFDPLSIDDMAAKIEGVLLDEERLSQIRNRGLRRAADFSWERCGRETLEVLLRAGGQEFSHGAPA